MGRCFATNSVFLPPPKVKEYRPIVISGPPSYGPRVKIHDWQLRSLDGTCGSRRNKNLRQSTYKRLGVDDDPIGISATRASTEQIYTASGYERDQRHRSLLNFYSFPLTETIEHKRAFDLTDLELPKPIEPTDYRTTLRDDYPCHFKIPPRPPQGSEIPDVPWLLYRRILGYNNFDLGRRSGMNKFLDDNMEMQNRAAACKMARFVSYDPMKHCYTDTKKYSDALLNNCANNQ